MRLQRQPITDEYVEDGEGVFLLPDHRVLALGPIPTAVLVAVQRGPVDLDDIVGDLVETFGAPGPGQDFWATLEAIVEELSELGLLAQLPD